MEGSIEKDEIILLNLHFLNVIVNRNWWDSMNGKVYRLVGHNIDHIQLLQVERNVVPLLPIMHQLYPIVNLKMVNWFNALK